MPSCQCCVLYILLSDLKVFSLRPLCLQVMQSICSAVPFTQKTAIIRISQLETHKQRHCLQVTTNMPAILAVFKLIQQLL